MAITSNGLLINVILTHSSDRKLTLYQYHPLSAHRKGRQAKVDKRVPVLSMTWLPTPSPRSRSHVVGHAHESMYYTVPVLAIRNHIRTFVGHAELHTSSGHVDATTFLCWPCSIRHVSTSVGHAQEATYFCWPCDSTYLCRPCS